MPATILLQTPGTGDDKRIKLANAQFARPFDVGSWTKIRIFCRWAASANSNIMSGVTTFMFGLCSGTTNLPGDASCQHAIGVGTNGDWNGSSTASYYGFGTVFTYMSKIGTTITTDLGGSGGAPTIGAIGTPVPLQRSLFFIDYTKGSPNWTMQNTCIRNASTTTVDTSYEDMLMHAEIESLSTVSGHVLSGVAKTFAVDEGLNGTLDSVCFWWPRTSPHIEISDLGIVRFA